MIDARTPSLLRLNERRVSCMMNGSARLTFRQLLGRALGCCCLRSNGLQPHCQQYHLTTIAVSSPLELTVWNGQRASNDNVIVGVCWELRDLVVDRSGSSRDDDGEE